MFQQMNLLLVSPTPGSESDMQGQPMCAGDPPPISAYQIFTLGGSESLGYVKGCLSSLVN